MHTLRKCRVWHLLLATLCAVIWTVLPAPLRAEPIEEYKIKAAFLFNFLQFVEWPADSFTAADSPIVLGVLGEDPFGKPLDELVREAEVNGRPIVVRRYERTEDVDVCHLLFVNVRGADRVRAVIDALNGRAVLTVGDTDGFLEQGGMIQFVTQDNRIRLRINLDSATAARLKLSSKLLRPAQVITTAVAESLP